MILNLRVKYCVKSDKLKFALIVWPQYRRFYQGAFKGQGIDFEEVREYQPGDEVRTIDWNVTAKTGAPFVKKYREERELTILLAVDISKSTNYGSSTNSKREKLAELSALLAFSANQNG